MLFALARANHAVRQRTMKLHRLAPVQRLPLAMDESSAGEIPRLLPIHLRPVVYSLRSCRRDPLPGNSLRGSAAQRTARRLCRSQHVYDGRAVCFGVTRQSHVTSLMF